MWSVSSGSYLRLPASSSDTADLEYHSPRGQDTQKLPQFVRFDAFQEKRVFLARALRGSVWRHREGEHPIEHV